MMSSVIPARLTFQCGHAALVTLPRVKGETSAQRNERVAREKSAALMRQCDFCGPTVEVEVALPTNGSHPVAVLSDVLDAQPILASEPQETVAPIVEAVVVEDLIEELAEEMVEQPAPVDEVLVIVEPVEEALEPLLPTRTPINGASHARRARGQRTTQTFVVEYQAERIVRAVDIHDALRRAAALGANEVLSLTREY
jgi:hypothetical protein